MFECMEVLIGRNPSVSCFLQLSGTCSVQNTRIHTYEIHPIFLLCFMKIIFLVRVLPSVFAKMGGQFPSCATLEQEIEGTWMKFLNNDGIVTGDQENQDEFRLKALAFAHWTFQKFDGKLLVCDLQGLFKTGIKSTFSFSFTKIA